MSRRALHGALMVIVTLGAMAPTVAISDVAATPIPNVLIDGAPWPLTLAYPIKKVSLSVYVPGAPEFVSREEQERIERVCADFLAEKIREVVPGIVVVARSAPASEADSRDPATVWAYYNVWLKKWTDVESNKETVLGVSMLSIHARMQHHDAPIFAPEIFQATRDPNAVSAAVQESISKHMITAIVAPLEASLRQ